MVWSSPGQYLQQTTSKVQDQHHTLHVRPNLGAEQAGVHWSATHHSTQGSPASDWDAMTLWSPTRETLRLCECRLTLTAALDRDKAPKLHSSNGLFPTLLTVKRCTASICIGLCEYVVQLEIASNVRRPLFVAARKVDRPRSPLAQPKALALVSHERYAPRISAPFMESTGQRIQQPVIQQLWP